MLVEDKKLRFYDTYLDILKNERHRFYIYADFKKFILEMITSEKIPLVGISIKWWSRYSLELMGMMYYLSLYTSQSLESMMILDLACTKIQNDGSCVDETTAESVSSEINTWKLTLRQFFSILTGSLIGLLMDKHSKLIIVALFIPVFGQIMCDIGNSIIAVYQWSPSHAGLFECLISGMTGSFNMFTLAASCYISHLTTIKGRTERMTYIFFTVSFGSSLGISVSGYSSSFLGLHYGFLICVALNIIALVIGFKLVTTQFTQFMETTEVKTALGLYPAIGNIGIIAKKDKEMKKIILFSLLCSLFDNMIVAGETAILYLYTVYEFNWTDSEYGTLGLVKFVSQGLLGTFVTTIVFQNYLKLDDTSILVLECTIMVVNSALLVFVNKPWEFYIGILFQLFNCTVQGVSTSITTKQFTEDEYGKMSSLIALVRGLSTIISYFLYTVVYTSTFSYMASAFFGVSFACALVTSLCSSYIYLLQSTSQN